MSYPGKYELHIGRSHLSDSTARHSIVQRSKWPVQIFSTLHHRNLLSSLMSVACLTRLLLKHRPTLLLSIVRFRSPVAPLRTELTLVLVGLALKPSACVSWSSPGTGIR